MLPETKKAAIRFRQITGIKPLSVKANAGSMRGYFTVKVSKENPAITTFYNNFYGGDTGGIKDNFNGLQITYLNVSCSSKTVYFDVRRGLLA